MAHRDEALPVAALGRPAAARGRGARHRRRARRCCSPTSPPATSTRTNGEAVMELLPELHRGRSDHLHGDARSALRAVRGPNIHLFDGKRSASSGRLAESAPGRPMSNLGFAARLHEPHPRLRGRPSRSRSAWGHDRVFSVRSTRFCSARCISQLREVRLVREVWRGTPGSMSGKLSQREREPAPRRCRGTTSTWPPTYPERDRHRWVPTSSPPARAQTSTEQRLPSRTKESNKTIRTPPPMAPVYIYSFGIAHVITLRRTDPIHTPASTEIYRQPDRHAGHPRARAGCDCASSTVSSSVKN